MSIFPKLATVKTVTFFWPHTNSCPSLIKADRPHCNNFYLRPVFSSWLCKTLSSWLVCASASCELSRKKPQHFGWAVRPTFRPTAVWHMPQFITSLAAFFLSPSLPSCGPESLYLRSKCSLFWQSEVREAILRSWWCRTNSLWTLKSCCSLCVSSSVDSLCRTWPEIASSLVKLSGVRN